MDNPQLPKQPSPRVLSHPSFWLIVLGLVIVGLAIGFFGYKITANNNGSTTTTNTTSNTNAKTEVVNQNAPASNTNTAINENTNSSAAVEPTARTISGAVTWSGPKKIAPLNILGKSTEGYDFEENADYYEVGTFKSGKYKGASIILHSYSEEGPSFYPTFEWFVKQDTKLTYLQKVSGEYYQKDIFTAKGVAVDTTTTLSDLEYPETLVGPDRRQILRRVTYANGLFTTDNLREVFVDSTYGSVYTNLPIAPTSPDGGISATGITARNGFYLRAPDGSIRIYYYQPDFLTYKGEVKQGGVLNATWVDGKKNTTEYVYSNMSGCGQTNYVALAPTDLSPTSGTTKVGTTTKGDALYAPTDSNHAVLKTMYSTTYQTVDNSSKVAYTDFVADRPVVFITDAFDRFIQLSSTKYQPQAECGKPVIYLYPETPTNVSVKLEPQGGFTRTEPTYGSGWEVTAQPDGTLTDRHTGITYPYLFWEGRGGIYESPNRGFLVRRNDVHAFLVQSLAKLGLNGKETADFIDFWEPRMQGSPYYVIGFYGTQVMNGLAPLTVTPKPDTVIRILMDFRPLNHPVQIKPQTLSAIPRQGFTVIEWGGVLR